MSYTAKRPFSANTDEVIGTVTFVEGATYRNKPFTGTYDLVKGFQRGGNGVGFVTIRETDGKKTRVAVAGENEGYTVEMAEVPEPEAA